MIVVSQEEELQQISSLGLNYGQRIDEMRKKEREVEIAEKIQPEFLTETIPAAFRLGNDIVAPLSSETFFDDFKYDTNYSPIDDLGEFADSAYADKLLAARNAEHMQALKNDITARNEDREILSNAGSGEMIFASLAAGIVSPFTLLPAAGIVQGARGAKVAKSIAKSAGVGIAAVAPSEFILRQADPTRTAQETIFTFSGAAILSGVLGGTVAKLSKNNFERLATQVEENIAKGVKFEPSPELEAFIKNNDSVGAARNTDTYLKEDLTITGKSAARLSQLSKIVNPYNRLINSPFATTRRLLTEGFETALELTAHADGRTLGPAAETMAKLFDKYRASYITALKDNFVLLKKDVSSDTTKNFAVFREEISTAIRNGDKSNNQYVQEAARKIRKEVLNPIAQEAQDAGILTKDAAAKFSETYLHRMWSKEKLIASPREAIEMFKQAMQVEVDKLKIDLSQRISGAERMYEGRISDLLNKIAKAKKELAEEKLPIFVKPSTVSEYEDSIVEFMGREISEADVNNYLSANNLQSIAEAVNIVNARLPRKPVGLYQFAKDLGGLYDVDDILKNANIKFGRSKRKITLENFGEKAYEAGYYNERPDINTIVDDLFDDMNDISPKYSFDEETIAIDYAFAKSLKYEAEEFLSEFQQIEPKQFWPRIKEEILNQKKEAIEIKAEAKLKSKTLREGARRLSAKERPLRVELKKLRSAKEAFLRKTIKRANNEIEKLVFRRKQKAANYSRELDLLDERTASDAANEIYRTLTGIGDQNFRQWVPPLLRGPLRNKTIPIPDNVAAPFLENDVAIVLNSYIRKMAGDTSLAYKFGTPDMRDQLAELDDEFQEMLLSAKTPKERVRLEKKYRSDRSDLENMRDLLRGTFVKGGDPDSLLYQSSYLLRAMAYSTTLGGVTLSSIGDVARHVMVHGIDNAFGDLFSRMNLNKDFSKLALEDLQEMSFGLETVHASRMATLADIGDPYSAGTAVTRFADQLSNFSSKVFLINNWNDMQKSFAALMSQNKILKILEKGDSATKDEINYLRFLGIDEGISRKIAEQYKLHGSKEETLRIAGVKQWDIADAGIRNAKRIYEAALKKEVDSTVVTKGIADAPIFSRTPIGGIMFQFTGYIFASHQRVLMRGLQKADASVVTGAMMMVAMGSIIAGLKQREIELSAELSGKPYTGVKLQDWTPEKWLYEGVDRSGLIALFMDANNRFERLGGYGATRALGIGRSQRYVNRNKLGVFLGPAAGDLEQLISLGIKPFDGKPLTENDIAMARSNIPLQNVTGLRHLLDMVQGEVSDNLINQ